MILKPSQYGYLVLCVTYEKGYLGQYKLTICSDNPIEDISDPLGIMKLDYSYHIINAWTRENSGGLLSELFFYKNPW